jgi:general secretion pathway protein A
MYTRHFGLQREPFSIAPDPRSLFMSERHREALAHLLYGQQGSGGFVLLTGEIGTGKTTLCRAFLEQVPPNCHVAYVFNPRLTVGELLQTVCEEFGVSAAGPGIKAQVDALNQFLLATHAAGGHCVLVIDEAQSLASDVLEQLRLLTNLETHERKLLQIILIGQPELREMLARPELEQLAQRVVARFHLGALDASDVAPYMQHRLAVAGLQGAMPFEAGAVRQVQRLTAGVPRRINVLADRALLGAYASGQHRVTATIVNTAAKEVFAQRKPPATGAGTPRRWPAMWQLPVAVAALAGLLWLSVLGLWFTGGTKKNNETLAVGVAVPMASAVASSAASASSSPEASAAAAASTPPSPSTVNKGPTASMSSGARAALDPLPEVVTPPLATPTANTEADVQRSLALLWGVSLPAGDVCELARAQGLSCFRSSTMTLALLRQLARPGLVMLAAEGVTPSPALLLGLANNSVSLRVGGLDQTVTLAAFARVWRGDFMSFYRSAPGGAAPTPAWLAEQLQRIDPASASLPAPSLASRIQNFQRAQGLPADGLAGALTLMQLNRALGVAEPRLIEERTP